MGFLSPSFPRSFSWAAVRHALGLSMALASPKPSFFGWFTSGPETTVWFVHFHLGGLHVLFRFCVLWGCFGAGGPPPRMDPRMEQLAGPWPFGGPGFWFQAHGGLPFGGADKTRENPVCHGSTGVAEVVFFVGFEDRCHYWTEGF